MKNNKRGLWGGVGGGGRKGEGIMAIGVIERRRVEGFWSMRPIFMMVESESCGHLNGRNLGVR